MGKICYWFLVVVAGQAMGKERESDEMNLRTKICINGFLNQRPNL